MISEVIAKLDGMRGEMEIAMDEAKTAEERFFKKIEKLKSVSAAKDETIAELRSHVDTSGRERDSAVADAECARATLRTARLEIQELTRAMTEFKKVSRTVALENENATLKAKIREAEECARQCRAELAMKKRGHTDASD